MRRGRPGSCARFRGEPRLGRLDAGTAVLRRAIANPTPEVPTSPDQNVAALLDASARAWPGMPALALGDATLADYATLAGRVGRLAGGMAAAGLVPGDRVALVARNVPQYVEALFACWRSGLVAVPVNAKLHPRELAFVLADSGARWAFVDAAWHAALPRVPGLERVVELGSAEHEKLGRDRSAAASVPCASADPAWLFYTSGTTGRPKGVIISHGNLRAMSRAFLSCVLPLAPGDALLHPAPLSHGSGLYLVPQMAAGAVGVVPESGGFDAGEICALVGAWPRACFFAAPTMVKRLVAAPALPRARLDHLKCVVAGGGPMYVADARAAVAALGPRLAQIYGQGESPMTITAMTREAIADAVARGDDARLGSVGIAQEGIELAIGDGEDRALPALAVGEVLVRGPTVMQGYWRNPEATRRTLANGWLHTGDVGSLDADGFLTLKDRSKDLIVSGGANIYPREVEEVLLLHPDVAEAAVIGRAHPDWGEEVLACIVARGAAATQRGAQRALEAALDALCLAHIARFKRPKAYAFLAELPKNNAGKVLKTALREMLAGRRPA